MIRASVSIAANPKPCLRRCQIYCGWVRSARAWSATRDDALEPPSPARLAPAEPPPCRQRSGIVRVDVQTRHVDTECSHPSGRLGPERAREPEPAASGSDSDLIDPAGKADAESRRHAIEEHAERGCGQEVLVARERVDPLRARPARKAVPLPEGRFVDLEARLGGRVSPLEELGSPRPSGRWWRRATEIPLHGELFEDEVIPCGHPPARLGIAETFADHADTGRAG